jgi:hypothetical protein
MQEHKKVKMEVLAEGLQVSPSLVVQAQVLKVTMEELEVLVLLLLLVAEEDILLLVEMERLLEVQAQVKEELEELELQIQ